MRSGLIDRWAARMLGRAESRSISDTHGGLIVDHALIWRQTLSLVSLLLIDCALFLLFLLCLPAAIWFYFLSGAYFLIALAVIVCLPRLAYSAVSKSARYAAWALGLSRDGRRGRSMSMCLTHTWAHHATVAIWLLVCVLAAIWWYATIGMPSLDTWTSRTFDVVLPVLDGWLVGAIVLSLCLPILIKGGHSWKIALPVLVSAGACWHYVLSAPWRAPGVLFYVGMSVVNLCIWAGTLFTVIRFVKEIRDEYKPGLDEEEEESLIDALEDTFRRPSQSSARDSGGLGEVLEM